MEYEAMRLSSDEMHRTRRNGSIRNAQIAKVLQSVLSEARDQLPPDVLGIDELRTLMESISIAADEAERASGAGAAAAGHRSSRPNGPLRRLIGKRRTRVPSLGIGA